MLYKASGTLNDANTSDTLAPAETPSEIHVTFDIANIIVNLDNFTFTVQVGTAGSERTVGYWKVTSNGVTRSIDTGSGVAAIVQIAKIDSGPFLVYFGEQVKVNYTKTAGADRNVPYTAATR